MSKKTLVKLYFSFAYPYLKCGVTSWGSGSVTMLKQPQVLQNKIIRIMVFKVPKDCVKMSTVYKSLNIRQIADIYDLEIAKFMHSFYHHNLPPVFDNYFKSLVSLATHSQSRLNSFQTVKTLFCIALPGHLDFISSVGCVLFLAGHWPQTTIPNERAYNY